MQEVESSLSLVSCSGPYYGTVKFTVKEAKELGNPKSRCDPFCTILIGGKMFKTAVCKKTVSPTWTEEFQAEVDRVDLMSVKIYDDHKQKAFQDSKLGTAYLKIRDLEPGKEHDIWLDVKKSEMKVHVAIQLTLLPRLEVGTLYTKQFYYPALISKMKGGITKITEAEKSATLSKNLNELCRLVLRWLSSVHLVKLHSISLSSMKYLYSCLVEFSIDSKESVKYSFEIFTQENIVKERWNTSTGYFNQALKPISQSLDELVHKAHDWRTEQLKTQHIYEPTRLIPFQTHLTNHVVVWYSKPAADPPVLSLTKKKKAQPEERTQEDTTNT